MSGILSSVYNTFIRSNAIFLSTIFVGAFATELAFDTGSNKIWDAVNRGRQWKDIKSRYVEQGSEEDDDDD